MMVIVIMGMVVMKHDGDGHNGHGDDEISFYGQYNYLSAYVFTLNY